MISDLSGPWYDFTEATLKTGLLKNEILYFIESGDIDATIYTNNRPFIAITNIGNKLTGHATFRYSGPLAADKTKILELVSDDRTILGRSPVELLQPLHIGKWQTINPFKCPFPNNFITDWQPCSHESTNTALLLPDECSLDWAHSSLAALVPDSFDEDTYFELYEDEYLIKSPVDQFVYDTTGFSVYYQNDLRLPASSLNKLKLLNDQHEAKTLIKTKKNLHSTTPKRCNELHQVIRRVLTDNPLATSKALWELIRDDFESGIFHYDRDELIHHIDNISIEWTNSNNIQQQLKWSSFQVLLSKLKKEPQGLIN